MKIKQLAVLFSAVLLMVGLAIPVSAEEAPPPGIELLASGQCGEDVFWELERDGLLTIFGEGYMDEWELTGGIYAPWYEFKDEIHSAVIAEGVTNIGNSCFYDCINLTMISIPDTVTNIGDFAFYHCEALASITIPDSVSSIGAWTFDSCFALASITIPEGVQHIGVACFQDCFSLVSAVLPDSLTKISQSIFGNCWNMQHVILPSKAFNVEKIAFTGCTSLKTISLPSDVTAIEAKVFYNCSNMTSIYFPASISDVGESAFYGCNNLVDVYYAGTEEAWSAIDIDINNECLLNAVVHYNTEPHKHSYVSQVMLPTCTEMGYTTYTCSCNDSYLSDHVNALGHKYINGTCATCEGKDPEYVDANIVAQGMCGKALSWVLDKKGNLTISGEGDMYDFSTVDIPWENVREQILCVVINKGATNIGVNAFAWCENLKELSIPEGVTSIDEGAFQWCESLDVVVIPSSVVSIGDYAFGYCWSLRGVLIPEGVRSIGEGAFIQCSYLHGVEIPSSVNHIGDGAFLLCEALDAIWVSEDNAFYSSDDFGVLFNKDKTELIIAPGGLLGDYTIPEGVTKVKDCAFLYCSNVTSIMVPASVSEIGNQVFFVCMGLREFDVAEDNLYYSCDEYGILYSKEKTVLISAPSLAVADNGCYVIPDSVTTISEYACMNFLMNSITIPKGITEIPCAAFTNCISLCSVTIPSSVTTIADQAFQDCSAITDVYFEGTEEQWVKISIGEYNEHLTTATIHFDGEEPDSGETESKAEIEVLILGGENAGIVVTVPANGWKTGTNTFTVSCEKPCVVAVSYDGGATYVRLDATAVAGGYSFTANDMSSGTIIAVAVSGDSNGDGQLTNADITRLSAAYSGKTALSNLEKLAADVNKSGDITNADITRLSAAYAEKTTLSW